MHALQQKHDTALQLAKMQNGEFRDVNFKFSKAKFDLMRMKDQAIGMLNGIMTTMGLGLD